MLHARFVIMLERRSCFEHEHEHNYESDCDISSDAGVCFPPPRGRAVSGRETREFCTRRAAGAPCVVTTSDSDCQAVYRPRRTGCRRGILASGQLAAGPRVQAFEKAFAELCHSPSALACTSGTAGLCLAMMALDLPPESKVLTTPFSFIATANCILGAGCRPVFCDVHPRTFMMTARQRACGVEKEPPSAPFFRCIYTGRRVRFMRSWRSTTGTGYRHRGLRQAHGASESASGRGDR